MLAGLAQQVSDLIEPFVGFDWTALLGFVTVFITAVLAKSTWSYAVKGAISSFVIALVSLVIELIEGGSFTWEVWANQSLQILLVHLGFWLMLARDWIAQVNAATDLHRGGDPDG